MKRLPARELALVCAPLLILLGLGFLFSRRQSSAPETTPLHLVFQLDKPTTLQAFQGADAVLKVKLQGTNANKFDFDAAPLLEVKTAHGVQTSRVNGYSGLWTKVWKGSLGGESQVRWPINSQAIPTGTLRLSVDAKATPISSATVPSGALTPLHLKGQWRINRAKIIPPSFVTLAPTPQVVLRSVKVTQVAPGAGTVDVEGECTFDLTGKNDNAQTPVEISFSGGGYSTGRGGISGIGWSSSSPSPQQPARRAPTWNVSSMPARSAKAKTVGRITGRISANNRWPLAFQIEPFDIARVKVGQQLKFKSWPASVPSHKQKKLLKTPTGKRGCCHVLCSSDINMKINLTGTRKWLAEAALALTFGGAIYFLS